ncbi:MAG TPA: 2-oxo acid dehydrogenase subunit E2 [Phycisphaerae bacterium]|nr:2-oxo acid dehydrogenase subunit E2 [Phycisphaerae bacterium]
MATEVKLPDLGEGVTGGDVVNIRVAVGDTVTAEQTAVEVETDKAVLEVPCPVGGTVTQVHVKQGDHIEVGQVLLTVDESERDAAPAESDKKSAAPSKEASKAVVAAAPVATAASPKAEQTSPRPVAAPAPTPAPDESDEVVPAGPGTRRLARELGVDLRDVARVYPDRRVTEDLVKAFVKQSMTGGATPVAVGGATAPPELPDFSQWGTVERVPFSTLQRKTAANLLAGWSNVPHVTQFDEADITGLEAFRRRFRDMPQGKQVKLTVTAFVLKALTIALKEYPRFNASLDARTNELILKRYYHIGVAVDTEAGLIVPVIRDIDQKNALAIASEMNEAAERARQRKVTLDELRGGTFTVTNLGGIGGTAFTPIVNFPEVAILGLARSRQQPRLIDGQWHSRLVLPLCLSYDHRVVNGADGARFIRRLVDLLENPEMMLLGI